MCLSRCFCCRTRRCSAGIEWVNAHRIVAGPQNESAFYQSYDPEQVVSKFRYPGEGFGGGHGNGATQLIKHIRLTKDFSPRFTTQASRVQDLLNALRQDIMLRLRMTGTTVLGTHDDADGGFTYKYAFRNSVGSISVHAPVHEATARRYPVPNGLDDVHLYITLEETWTRPATETQWWMAAVELNVSNWRREQSWGESPATVALRPFSCRCPHCPPTAHNANHGR